jgi:hypothetical protein
MTSRRKIRALVLVWSVLFLVLVGTFIVQNGARTAFVQAQSYNINPVTEGEFPSNIVTTPKYSISSSSIQSPENKTYNCNNLIAQFTISAYGLLSEAPTSETKYFPNASKPLSSNSNWVNLFDTWFTFFVGANLDFNTSNYVSLFNGNETGSLTTPASLPVHISQYISNQYMGNMIDSSNNTVYLTNLTQGPHTLTVWVDIMVSGAVTGYLESVYSTVWFNVDSVPANITIQSPSAATYSTSEVPLNFTINKPVSELTYSLDNGNITTGTNMTLTGLSDGEHNLTIYASDTAGNIANQTVTFNVQQSAITPPNSTNLPNSLLLIAVPVAVICTVAGLLLVIVRHRKTSQLKC